VCQERVPVSDLEDDSPSNRNEAALCIGVCEANVCHLRCMSEMD
jgi:hypothetical protein